MIGLSRMFKGAMKSLLKNRMRSLLTSLGVVIGVCAVIVMVGIGAGAQADVEAQIQSLGANMLLVLPSSMRVGGVSQGAGSRAALTLDDAEDIMERATLVTAVSPVVRTGGQVIGGGNNWSTQINGVSPEYLEIRDWSVESGEFFTERDVMAKSKVAVLGQTVVENLFPTSNPVGEQIRISNTPFTVIGVLSSKGQSGMGNDEDDVVLTPSTTALYRLSGGQNISMINASAVSLEQSDAAIEELTGILRESHKLEYGEEDDFRIFSQAEILETATETQQVMTLLLGSVAAVSLLVGGIGIMNIMLVSVTERTREIGIRLSVGARGSDILKQFLTESVVLSLTGGIIGTALAYAVVMTLDHAVGLSALISPGVVLVAFGFASAIGVFFGYYPARRAAMLNPIAALRHE